MSVKDLENIPGVIQHPKQLTGSAFFESQLYFSIKRLLPKGCLAKITIDADTCKWFHCCLPHMHVKK